MDFTISPYDPYNYVVLSRLVQANQEEARTLNGKPEKKSANPSPPPEKNLVSGSEWWNE